MTAPIGGKGGSGASFSGVVKANGNPVAGASVQLDAAGASGSGSSAAALLATALTTETDGSFSVPSGYACDASATQVYLLARGGIPASSSGQNSSPVLMSALGTCTDIASGSAIVINEATTVAAMAALAPFYSADGNVGASSTNSVGLANALITAANLVDLNTGASPSTVVPAALSVSSAKLNTLANALAVCSAASSACAPLLAAAAPPSGLGARQYVGRGLQYSSPPGKQCRRDLSSGVGQIGLFAGPCRFAARLDALRDLDGRWDRCPNFNRHRCLRQPVGSRLFRRRLRMDSQRRGVVLNRIHRRWAP